MFPFQFSSLLLLTFFLFYSSLFTRENMFLGPYYLSKSILIVALTYIQDSKSFLSTSMTQVKMLLIKRLHDISLSGSLRSPSKAAICTPLIIRSIHVTALTLPLRHDPVLSRHCILTSAYDLSSTMIIVN